MLLLLAAWSFGAGPADAASEQRKVAFFGILDAAALEALPAGANFRVRAMSGTRSAALIADLFRHQLGESGYRVAADAAYVLSFQLGGENPADDRDSGFELRGQGGSSDAENVQLTMRWRAKRGDTAKAERRRRLLVTVRDDQRRLIWRARVALPPTDRDDAEIVEAIAPAIVAQLGRTVYALRVP
jgi:hypothetical protein